jgi:hypothetical protein
LYGVRGKERDWFRNYLITELPNYLSHGLPQGSKLSNVLFILFINDINLHTKHRRMILFAVDKIDDDLKQIGDWLKYNKMAINIKKLLCDDNQ